MRRQQLLEAGWRPPNHILQYIRDGWRGDLPYHGYILVVTLAVALALMLALAMDMGDGYGRWRWMTGDCHGDKMRCQHALPYLKSTMLQSWGC
mmetsp:Transcript_8849/g.23905  ORF Transcript_8849/g.23905 Transcript_8849/m.23905 type:complete len:93 (+) Transcript_8849:105-383(+)